MSVVDATSTRSPQMIDATDVAALTDRVRRLLEQRQRIVIGLAGEPGVGKSTLSSALIDHADVSAAVIPFDGFHLATTELERLGRTDRQGAIDTFDITGYRDLLRRLTSEPARRLYAPGFSREIGEPIARAITVDPSTRLIITEGNYLLVPEAGIERRFFDEVWYVELNAAMRRQRLIARHIRYGKDPDEAIRWADGSDEDNARIIRPSRHLADVIVRLA
jgi:pantothenate kinase